MTTNVPAAPVVAASASTFLAGMFSAWAVALVGLGLFFFRAWYLRKGDREYLLFGFLALTMSLYTTGVGVMYAAMAHPGGPTTWGCGAALTLAGAIGSWAFGLHFAVHAWNVPRERPLMGFVYVTATAYLAYLALGHWWVSEPDRLQWVTWGSVLIPCVVPAPTAGARSFYVVCIGGTLAFSWLLGHSALRGKDDQRLPFVGSVLLAAAVVNDVSLGAGLRAGVYLVPLGFLPFTGGVSFVLLKRYGNLSRELGRRNEQLRRRTSELKRSHEALERTYEQLLQKNHLAAVGELSAIIAHEVRNPLAIISNALATLQKPIISEGDHRTLLRIIEEETTRLNQLVSNLLGYARPVTLQRQPTDMHEVLRKALALKEGYPDVHVRWQTEAGFLTISADATLLRHAFDNLIRNALQAMNGRGTLTVSVVPHGTQGAMVQIQDTGEGMDTSVRVRARTPFFTTRPRGTGLGLAIVDRIVEAHGGRVTLQSEAGVGTTVSVVLP